jgi:hypothetical protein
MGGGGRGEKDLPAGGPDWALGRRRRQLHGNRRAAAALRCGGGSPVALGGRGWAWGLRWKVRKVAVVSIWEEEGRRGGSTWSSELNAAMAAPARGRRHSGVLARSEELGSTFYRIGRRVARAGRVQSGGGAHGHGRGAATTFVGVSS